ARLTGYLLGMRRYVIFIVAVPVALLFVRLGLWQLDRLGQRRALNASLDSTRALSPLDISTNPPGELPRFRRVEARGAFDFDHQVVIDARSFDGVPSVVVVTPLRLQSGKAVLVERGSAISMDAHRVDLVPV